MSKTERMFELMVRIYEKQRFTVNELAEEFGVSYRTMLRYIHELSGLGVPLYSETGKHGGYSIINTASKPSYINSSNQSINRVIKSTTHVIGVELKAPFTAVYMAKAIRPRLWNELTQRQKEITNQYVQDSLIGVSLSKNRVYHYIAGIEVTKPYPVPQGMVSITIPTREYAVYTHAGKCDREDFDETYFYMLDRLRKQGLNHNPDAYSLEVFNVNKPNEYTIYLPLKDKY